MKRHYLGIWMLLLTAFMIFFALSIVGNTTLGAFELRTANMYDKLTYIEPASVVLEPEPVASLPVLDTVPQRILLMGDSML